VQRALLACFCVVIAPVACEGSVKRRAFPGAQQSEGAMKDETFASKKDGTKIYVRTWRPGGPARAVLIIVHGFKAHSGLYDGSAEQFAQRGLAVYALDHRGHGNSEGERYFAEHVSDFVDDLDQLVELVRSREPGLQLFMLGHSAGGVISCVYALEHQDKLAGLICESFAHEVPAPEFALSVIKGLSHIAPHLHVLDLKNKLFSRDPAFVKRMDEDPLIPQMNYPALTVAALVRADERLKQEFPLITLPVLILHGTEDKVTVPAGSQRFHDHAGSKDKTLRMYEGHAHDLLADLGKDQVMADITDWLEARIAPAPQVVAS
jgi:acylglycerol lipase